MKNPGRTYPAIILSMIFWALSFIWFKEANKELRPITIVFSRLVISSVLLSIYLYLSKNFVRIRKEDRGMFLMLALFEPFLYFLGESFGLTYVSATVGSVIISTIPVVAAIGAIIIFRERLHAINYVGIVISFIGILVFLLNKRGTLSFNIKGLALLMLAVISATGYNLTLSRLVGKYGPVFIVCTQNIIGTLLFAPLFLVFELHHLVSVSFSISNFVPVIELALFASCGAFILFAYSVGNMGITKANVFSNCIPVFTAIFSIILLGEKLSVQNVAGMLIVITGLFLSQMDGRRKDTDEALILTGKTA